MSRHIGFSVLLSCLASAAIAEEAPILNETGQAGLIRYPSARSLPTGTITTGAALGRPYQQAYLGWQPLPALNVTIRQAQENRTHDTFPGVDAKLQIWAENDWLPQTAIGYQHALGQGRFGGEYLVASKRVWELDWNLGAGWGRLGRDRALPNPFGASDSTRDRGLGSAGPSHWLRGKRLGLFGGVNYHVTQPFTIQLEYDADDYHRERNDGVDINKHIPVNLGLHYQYENLGVGVSWQQADRLGLQVSYQWQPQQAVVVQPAPPVTPMAIQQSGPETVLVFRNPADQIPAAGLGQAAHRLSQQTAKTNDLTLIPEQSGLTATAWHLPNWSDQAEHSAAEIWQSTTVTTAQPPNTWQKPAEPWRWQIGVQATGDVYQPGTFLINREKLLFGGSYEPTAGLFVTALGRVDSASHTADIIERSNPVRSWLNQYTRRGYGLERGYMAILDNLTPELHFKGMAGQLEEMFGGAGGELLYQPLRARWALGLEGYHLYARTPDDDLGWRGTAHDTGFASFYFETPAYHLTSIVRVGQFLANDQGVVAELRHHLENGIQIGLLNTYSNRADFNGPFHHQHWDVGLGLTVPLQRFTADMPATVTGAPMDVNAGLAIRSLGRDKGQLPDIPMPLFTVTRPVRYGPISSTWQSLLTQLP